MFFEQAVNSEQYVNDFFLPLLRALRKGKMMKKKRHGYVMLGGVATYAVNCSINVLKEVFEDRLISRRLWPAVSPDVNFCDVCKET
jgi:hypothetical protein